MATTPGQRRSGRGNASGIRSVTSTVLQIVFLGEGLNRALTRQISVAQPAKLPMSMSYDPALE